jgi:hypothetical protein
MYSSKLLYFLPFIGLPFVVSPRITTDVIYAWTPGLYPNPQDYFSNTLDSHYDIGNTV